MNEVMPTCQGSWLYLGLETQMALPVFTKEIHSLMKTKFDFLSNQTKQKFKVTTKSHFYQIYTLNTQNKGKPRWLLSKSKG